MKRRSREVNVFNLSMLDVMTGALGAVMIIMIVLLTQKIGAEEESSPTKLTENAKVLTTKALELKEKAVQSKDTELEKKALEIANEAAKITKKALEVTVKDALLKQKEEALKKREEELKKQQKDLKKIVKNITPDNQDSVAFKIPKKVVLVLDLSGSMDAKHNSYKEDRISQVKAALKMFVAGMDQEYSIDLVFFPAFEKNISKKCQNFKIKPALDPKCKHFDRKDDAYDEPGLNCYKYGYFNGALTHIFTEKDKYKFYQKLSCLNAYHATPTKSAMEFVLDNPKYDDAEGIILFSDGQPDSINDGRHTIDSLISTIKGKNKGNKKIFTVGVGTEFREQKDTTAVNFLRRLAKESSGFYIGF